MTYYKSRLNIKSIDKKARVILNLGILVILLAFIGLYLFQINNLVAANFELRHLQSFFKSSQEKNQSLSISLLQLRSLNNLQQAAKDLNLVSIEKPNYLKVTPGFFALSE